MQPKAPSRAAASRAFLMTFGLGLAASLSDVVRAADLVANSPFSPHRESAIVAATDPAGELELRGVMSVANGYSYCIFEAASGKCVWAGLKEPGNDFVIIAADPERESATILRSGRTLTLRLKESRVSAVAAVPGHLPRPLPIVTVAGEPTVQGGQVGDQVPLGSGPVSRAFTAETLARYSQAARDNLRKLDLEELREKRARKPPSPDDEDDK